MNRLGTLALTALVWGALPGICGAQQVRPAATTNRSVTITLGNTFQTILSAQERISLTIQNNLTTTDNCWIFIGTAVATKGTSILLGPGVSYTRYYPFIPNDAIQATCASTNDTLYVDTQ